MKKNQRVVKSVKDKAGNNYTKTAAGGKARMVAATRYMDEQQETQLYDYERGELKEADRHHAAARIENTETKYQQHMVFTTELKANGTYVDERSTARQVAESIQQRRPDAEIYALAVHADGQNDEQHVHVHVAFGTNTTLRRDDLKHFREQSFQLEQALRQENELQAIPELEQWHAEVQAERVEESTGVGGSGRAVETDDSDPTPQKQTRRDWDF